LNTYFKTEDFGETFPERFALSLSGEELKSSDFKIKFCFLGFFCSFLFFCCSSLLDCEFESKE